MAKRTYSTFVAEDAEAVAIITDLIDSDGRDAVIEKMWDAWSARGEHVGAAYLLDEDMVDYIAEAVAAGGIDRMEAPYVGNRPIGV